MKVKNIVRKAVALGTGAGVFATTIVGALAYDLSTYPAKYIVDGQFDGKIVVGERAATADVLGSIDIAASLQSASTSAVQVPGQSGRVVLSGDSFEIGTSSDMLELREAIDDVVDTITVEDLAGLKGGRLTTSEGSTDYSQYLRLQNTDNSLQNITVNYVKNDGVRPEVMSDFLVVDTDAPFIQWEIQFDQGFESELADATATAAGDLEDFEDKTLNIMGTDYTIVSAEVESDGQNFEMQLMGGSVPDTLREGETKTYNINGVVYEVTLVFISDPNQGTAEAKFSVNGELTDSMSEGDTETLSGGLQIGVRDILVNAREGVASFFLGADKLVLTDPVANATSWDGDIEVNEEVSENDVLTVSGSFIDSTTFEITSIEYRVTMESEDGSGGIAYVPAGHGVRELMEEPELLISDSLDIRYEGLTQPSYTEVEFTPSAGDDEYSFSFTNIDGDEYTNVPLLNAEGTLKWGDEDNNLTFYENNATANVVIDDYIVLSSRAIADGDRSVTNIVRYNEYDADTRTVEFEDLAGGVYTTVLDATTGDGTINVGGNSYAVSIDLEDDGDITGTGENADDQNLFVDVNGDGNAYGEGTLLLNESFVTVQGGAYFTFEDSTPVSPVDLAWTVPQRNFDTASGGETFTATFTESSNEIDASFAASSYVGNIEGDVAGVAGEFQFDAREDNADVDVGMTDYGILISLTETDDSTDSASLTVAVPSTQVGAQVWVTMGDVSTSSTGTGGAQRVNPIAVGLAVLDTDAPAVGTENLIVVGGPCANTVAAELLGNPSNCAEGFEPGRAVIRSWDKGNTVAILVAGYEATETLGASRVLASYRDYSDKLQGEEVEVVVADLNSIQVNAR